MAFRLRLSSRALREIGETQEWYELQSPGLGEEFIAAAELQIKRLEQAPLLYAEVILGVRRAFLPRFPFGLFYAVRGDLVHVLAALHDARNPRRWPKKPRQDFFRTKDGCNRNYAIGNSLPLQSPAHQAGNVIGIVVAKLDALKMAAGAGDLPRNVNFAIRIRSGCWSATGSTACRRRTLCRHATVEARRAHPYATRSGATGTRRT